METVSKLWNGDLVPASGLGERNEEIQQVKRLLLRNKNEIEKMLSDAQKKHWENYIFCAEEYLLLLNEEAFCRGFSLGMRLAVDAL